MKDVCQDMNFVHAIENNLIKIFEETLIELNEYLSPAGLLMKPRTSVKADSRYFQKPPPSMFRYHLIFVHYIHMWNYECMTKTMLLLSLDAPTRITCLESSNDTRKNLLMIFEILSFPFRFLFDFGLRALTNNPVRSPLIEIDISCRLLPKETALQVQLGLLWTGYKIRKKLMSGFFDLNCLTWLLTVAWAKRLHWTTRKRGDKTKCDLFGNI